MPTIFAYCCAGISTLAFMFLWFWAVYQELKRRKSVVESARCQLSAIRIEQMRAQDSLNVIATQRVLIRSLDIYRQSTDIYHQTLKKPWNHIPGLLMGFRQIKEEIE